MATAAPRQGPKAAGDGPGAVRNLRADPVADLGFTPIVGPRAVDEVIDQITRAIRSGRVSVGRRLPSVPDMAIALGVSRPIISDAIGELSSHGVVEIRRGAHGGVRIVSADIPVTLLRRSKPLNASRLTELLEARRPIEMELARLAAVRGTSEDFEELARANDALISAPREGVSWSVENNHFHYSFGRAARSPALAYLQHDILEQIAVALNDGTRYSDRTRAIESHICTLDALRTRDLSQVDAAMDSHLRELEDVADWLDDQALRERAGT